MAKKRIMAFLLLLALSVTLLAGCGSKTETTADYASARELEGKCVGVVTGTIFDQLAQENIPGVDIAYFNADPDLPVALDTEKVDAYVIDEPIFRSFSRIYPSQYVIEQFSEDEYAYIFPKGNERYETICTQLNAFLHRAWEDGTVDAAKEKWIDGDASKAHIDYSGLTGENGTLRFATSTESGMVFDMLTGNGEYGGYDIELLVQFCREYGYMLEVTDYSFNALIAAVTTGKADIGACTISITEERKESMLFSEPNYHGGTVLVGQHVGAGTGFTSAKDMEGKRIGVVTGSVFDKIAEEKVPGCRTEYLNAMSDIPTALEAGKIDGYLADEPVYRNIARNYPNEYIIEQLTTEDYAFLFPKDSEKHKKICAQLSEFISASWEDGTLQELATKWIDGDYEKASVDYDGMTGENGTLTMAITSEVGAPFTFMQNGAFAGYDVEVAVRFCKKYGYALEIMDYSISGMLSATSSGKADMAAGCVSITEERKESILFSEPDYHGGILLIGTHTAGEKIGSGIAGIAGIMESFNKTFIRESRWKLFVNGIGVTLLITFLSTVLGTVLGFGIYMLYRKNFKPFNILINILTDILEKTPVVVVLMILFYIIFGDSDLSGVWVAVVGFTVMFACSFVSTVKVGVMAVDKGQTEASLALGFTDTRSFIRVILPQAAKHFLPGYRGQIVALLKDTAIVGYIAVQDLTKVGDIVRSRTYEAFFPLIATAVIYFLMAWLLTLFVERIEFRTDPTKRSREAILKGVKTK